MRAIVWTLRDGQLMHAATVDEAGHTSGPLAEELQRWVKRSGKAGREMLELLAKRWTTGYMAAQLVDDAEVEKGGKVYLPPGEKPPEGVHVEEGPRGGHYYESQRPEPKEEFGFSPDPEPEHAPTLAEIVDYPGWHTFHVESHNELFDRDHLNVRWNLGDYDSKYVEAAWRKLPVEHFKGIREVRLGDANRRELARYDRADNSITLEFRGAEWMAKEVKQQAADHEVGHAVFDGLWRPTGMGHRRTAADKLAMALRRSSNEAYATTVKQCSQTIVHLVGFGIINQNDLLAVNQAHAVTPYALSSPEEWFAENYSFYVMYPKLLRYINPGMYSIIKRVFGGKEY